MGKYPQVTGYVLCMRRGTGCVGLPAGTGTGAGMDARMWEVVVYIQLFGNTEQLEPNIFG